MVLLGLTCTMIGGGLVTVIVLLEVLVGSAALVAVMVYTPGTLATKAAVPLLGFGVRVLFVVGSTDHATAVLLEFETVAVRV